VRRPSFTELGEDIGQSFLRKKFVSAFGFLAAFSNDSNESDSKMNNVLTTPDFALFDPPPL